MRVTVAECTFLDNIHSATTVTMCKCPLLLLMASNKVAEATTKSAPVLCSVHLPCLSDHKPSSAIQEICQNHSDTLGPSQHTHVDTSHCSHPTVFLSCGWPT